MNKKDVLEMPSRIFWNMINYKGKQSFWGSFCVDGCYNSIYCERVVGCEFCVGCDICVHCLACVGLKKKKYCIFNVQLTEKEYHKKYNELCWYAKKELDFELYNGGTVPIKYRGALSHV